MSLFPENILFPKYCLPNFFFKTFLLTSILFFPGWNFTRKKILPKFLLPLLPSQKFASKRICSSKTCSLNFLKGKFLTNRFSPYFCPPKIFLPKLFIQKNFLPKFLPLKICFRKFASDLLLCHSLSVYNCTVLPEKKPIWWGNINELQTILAFILSLNIFIGT